MMLTTEEVSKRLDAENIKVTPEQVAQLAKNQAFPNAEKDGNRWLIPAGDVDAFIQLHKELGSSLAGKQIDHSVEDSLTKDAQAATAPQTRLPWRQQLDKPEIKLGLIALSVAVLALLCELGSNLGGVLQFFPTPTPSGEWCVIRVQNACVYKDLPPSIANCAAEGWYGLPLGAMVYVVDTIDTIPGLFTWYRFDDVDLGPVTVSQVLPNSPAEKAGLQPGDVVISIDGIMVDTSTTIIDYVAKHLNQSVSLEIERRETRMTIGVMPEMIDGQSRIGARLQGGTIPVEDSNLKHGYILARAVSCE